MKGEQSTCQMVTDFIQIDNFYHKAKTKVLLPIEAWAPL